MNKELKTKGRTLTYALRHAPQEFDIILGEGAWANVDDVLKGIGLTMSELSDIVLADNKGRFSFNKDGIVGSKIRANQGHSVNVDLELPESIPPEYLYHGTVEKFWQWIKVDGIKKMARHHVHLSEDVETALTVASRRKTDPVLIVVYAKDMYDNGIKFYKSENGVWLTDYVDTKYFDKA